MSQDESLPVFFSFAWWNTSLSPPIGRSRGEDCFEAASIVLEVLTNELEIDFIALGEVSLDDQAAIADIVDNFGYGVIDGFSEVGRSKFGMCFLYKIDTIQVSTPEIIVTSKLDRTLRIAQQLDIFVRGDSVPFHFFVLHWPSRLSLPPNHADRMIISQRLRGQIEEIYDYYEAPPRLVVLGDFNEEPFSESLTEVLCATRDRSLVSRKKTLLYNPFWREFGIACGQLSQDQVGGSYYYQNGNITKWFIFDQIILSSCLLEGGDWELIEEDSMIINMPEYARQMRSRKSVFDHAPIYGVVKRRGSNG